MSPDSKLDGDLSTSECTSRAIAATVPAWRPRCESLRCCRRSTASAKLLHPKRLVDLHRRQRSLRRGDRKLLIPARGITNDVHTRDVGRLVISGTDGALRCELAAEESCEVRSLLLPSGEEER